MASATPLRIDAQRNRDALLAAARVVFANGGLDAPLYEVARAAGVGQGTLYRRFPTRAALVEAVARDYVAQVQELGEQAGEQPDALFALFRAAAQLQRENRALLDVLAAHPLPTPVLAACRATVDAVFAAPLRHAQHAGLARTDVAAEDVRLLLRMTGATSRGAPTPGDAERAVELALDALASPRASATAGF